MISPKTSLGGLAAAVACVVGMLVRCYAARVRGANGDISALRFGSGSADIVGRIAGIEAASVRTEDSKIHDAEFLQSELQSCCEHAETVLHAAPEIDGRGIFKILGRARDFTDAEAEVNALCEHLVVEDEIIGILEQRELG